MIHVLGLGPLRSPLKTPEGYMRNFRQGAQFREIDLVLHSLRQNLQHVRTRTLHAARRISFKAGDGPWGIVIPRPR
jgi:hypothetical protein